MTAKTPTEQPPSVPRLSLAALFGRFLRFGCLAWGGPIAQIAMLKKELVEEERWVSVAHFQRALAVYQALPGPEAHELCVWFGMLARGRVGAVLAGLGFMLPGLVLMLVLAWAYVHVGLKEPGLNSVIRTGFGASIKGSLASSMPKIRSRAAAPRCRFALIRVSCLSGLKADKAANPTGTICEN